jgi:hypothetical protein
VKTIGVQLQKNITNTDVHAVWKKIESGYLLNFLSSVDDQEVDDQDIESFSIDQSLSLNLRDLPNDCKDHDLYSWVTRGDQVFWINTFNLTKSQRLSVADFLATTGQILQAHLVTTFATDEPMLILFGRCEDAFADVRLDEIVSEQDYNRKIRPSLFPGLRVSAKVTTDGLATATAQLLEADGSVSTRSDVLLYWEATGGYWLTERTSTVNGKAVATLKDFGSGVRVKVGFKNYPAKAEVLL